MRTMADVALTLQEKTILRPLAPSIGYIGGTLMLNQGSPTDTRFADRNTTAIL
jgi:hypothetical protein